MSACVTGHRVTQKNSGSQNSNTSDLITPADLHVELSSREVVSGTIAWVTVSLPDSIRSGDTVIRAEFEGSQIPFFLLSQDQSHTYAGILAIPYERKPGPGVLFVHTDGKTERGLRSLEVPLSVISGNYPSEILHVDGRRVSPTRKKDLIRIKREQLEIGEIYRHVTRERFWTGPFAFPIESSVTSPFGTRRVYNGELKSFHTGLDLKAPMHTPIYTAAPGIVVLAKDLFYTGNTVMVDHGYGIITVYAHMSRLKVQKGEKVSAHQLLGLSGKTGRVTGPHLHWQAVVHSIKVDPRGLTQVMR